jgi:hypothetical protein
MPADENHRHLLVRVPVRVAHVAALVDQHVVQQRAVAVGVFFSLSQKYARFCT